MKTYIRINIIHPYTFIYAFVSQDFKESQLVVLCQVSVTCLKLTVKTPKKVNLYRSDFFIINAENGSCDGLIILRLSQVITVKKVCHIYCILVLAIQKKI